MAEYLPAKILRILPLAVTGLFCALVSDVRAQTQYFWRGDAGLNGNWNASDKWWTNAPAPAGFGQLNFNNNAYLVGTNDSAFGTWRIYFDAAASQARTNGGVGQITFYDSSGNVPLIRNDSTATHILNMPMRIGNLSGDRRLEIIAANGDLTFGGQFTTEDNGPSGGDRLLFVTNGTGRLVTMSGVITEAATRSAMRVQKEGSGTLILSGGSANTHSGGVTVNGGTLILNKSAGVNAIGSGALTIASGATVSASAFSQFGSSFVNNFGTLNFNNNSQQMALGGSGIVNLGTATLTNTNTGDDTFSGQITGSGSSSLIKAGSGTLRLTGTSSSYTGPTTILGGLLAINADGSLGTAPGSATANSVVISNATLGFNGSTTLNANRGMTLNTSGTLSVFSGNTVTYNGIVAQAAAGAILDKAGSGTLILGGNNSFSGATTIGNGAVRATSATAFGTTAGGVNVSSGAAVELSGTVTVGSEALTLNGAGVGSGGALRNITDNNTWQGAITLGSASRINSDAGTLTLDVASGNVVSGTFDLTIGGNGNVAINDNIGIGTAKLVKDGPGTLTIGAVNNYTGNTEIDAGTLAIGSTGGLSGSSMLYVGSGLNGSDATLSVAGTTTLANAIQVNTNNGTSGTRTIIKSDATSQTLSGNFTNNIQTSVNVANSAGNLAISGAMAGAGNIVKSGSGTLALSGSSGSFSGGLFVDQGTLHLAGGSTGASAIEIGGGATVNAINASNAALRVSANSTFSQALTINANTNASGQSGTRTIDFANSGGTATLSGTLSHEKAFTVNVANAGATGILSGLISSNTTGGTTITVSGNGILGVNNTGNTTDARWSISSGSTLAIGNSRNLGADPGGYYSDKVTLNGGTLQATNSFGLNANVGIQLGASTTSTISVGSGLAMTNPAVMGGSGNLTKSGSGTLVLSGNNTYTGSTTVSQGELRMMGVLSSSSLLNVSAGATLSGTGTIGGATTISGIHSPGTSPGIQTFSSGLTYNAGSTNVWELTSNTSSPAARGTSYDGINLGTGANLTFAGTTKMSLVFNSAGSSVSWSDTFWSSDKSWLVYDLNGGSISGTNNFSVDSINWADSQGNLFTQSRPEASFSISVSGQDLNLIYTIPEPSTYALLALSGIALGFYAYRRRRRPML